MSRKITILSLLTLKCMLVCFSVAAAPAAAKKALEDKQLSALLRTLQRIDGYACRIRISKQVIGDTVHLPSEQSLNYLSRQEFIYYTRSATAVSLVCDKGQFRADLQAKKVYYTPYTDSMVTGIRQSLKAQAPAGLDSLLLPQATIAAYKKQQQILSYELHFDPGAPLTDMKLKYRLKDSVLLGMEYTVERQLGSEVMIQRNKGVRMRQQVVTDQYSREMPEELRLLLPQINDLYTYLQKTYQGFTLEKI